MQIDCTISIMQNYNNLFFLPHSFATEPSHPLQIYIAAKYKPNKNKTKTKKCTRKYQVHFKS